MRNRFVRHAAVPFLVSLAVALPAYPQGAAGAASSPSAGATSSRAASASPSMSRGNALARGDRNFIEKAAAGGMFEVEAGKLAQARAQDSQVKAFGTMLVEHHGSANAELQGIASSKGVTPPAELPRAERRMLEKLGKKEGAEFDREFVRDVGVKAHEKDIKLFEKQGKDGKDAELKAFAAKTLPVLRSHLDAARKLPGAGK